MENAQLNFEHSEYFNLFTSFRKLNPDIRIILSLSGGENNGFSSSANTPEKRKELVCNVVKAVREYDFDGVDVDWEFPTVNGIEEERDWHTELLSLFRTELDNINPLRRYWLSIAAPSGSWCFKVIDLQHSIQYLDYVNLMTYDMAAGSRLTCHHTAAYAMSDSTIKEASVAENLDIFSSYGIPIDKILIGAAFYSRQWKNVSNKNEGLFVFTESPSNYGPRYSDLLKNYINLNGYTRYWDNNSKAPYLFNGENFITYDDPESLAIKCRMVRETGAAGIMIWEYSYDETHELVGIINSYLA